MNSRRKKFSLLRNDAEHHHSTIYKAAARCLVSVIEFPAPNEL